MEHCASCERELAAHWNFCVYCGRPFAAATQPKPAAAPIETDSGHGEPRQRKYDGAFWVGVGMGALGLVLIVYAAVQIYGSQV